MITRVLYLLYLIAAVFMGSGCQKQPAYESDAIEVFPAVAIKYAALFRMDQFSIAPAFFRGQWTAVVFASSSCEADCQHRLSLLNEVKDAQTLLVIDDLADYTQLRALKKRYPSVAVSMGTTAASLDKFMAQFDEETIPANEKKAHIYVVNPLPELSHILAVKGLESGDIDRELEHLKKAFQQGL